MEILPATPCVCAGRAVRGLSCHSNPSPQPSQPSRNTEHMVSSYSVVSIEPRLDFKSTRDWLLSSVDDSTHTKYTRMNCTHTCTHPECCYKRHANLCDQFVREVFSPQSVGRGHAGREQRHVYKDAGLHWAFSALRQRGGHIGEGKPACKLIQVNRSWGFSG